MNRKNSISLVWFSFVLLVVFASCGSSKLHYLKKMHVTERVTSVTSQRKIKVFIPSVLAHSNKGTPPQIIETASAFRLKEPVFNQGKGYRVEMKKEAISPSPITFRFPKLVEGRKHKNDLDDDDQGKWDGLAIISIVFGVLGLFLARFLFGLLAVIHGIVSLIFKPNSSAISKLVAIAGIILGALNMYISYRLFI